jgi:hypothetical protein
MRVARVVREPRREKRIEGAVKGKEGGKAGGKAGGGGGRAHHGFVERAGIDEGKVHLERGREGGRERGEGVRVCKCARKPGGRQKPLLPSLLPLLTLTLTSMYAHWRPAVQPV